MGKIALMDKPISQLTARSSVAGTDRIPVFTSTGTEAQAATVDQIAASATGLLDNNNVWTGTNGFSGAVDIGKSGTAGSVDVFPTTAASGKLTLACTDQTGDTAVTVNANAMGQATTLNLADPGIAAAYIPASTAAITVAEMDILDGATVTTAELNILDGVTATAAELSTKELFVTMADISTGSSVWIPSPVAGTITAIYTIINGTIATADALITAEINTVAVTDSTVTIAYNGSAAGDVDSSAPSAANVVAVGDSIELITNGASTNTIIATIVVVITL